VYRRPHALSARRHVVQHTITRFAALLGVASALSIAAPTAEAMTVRIGDPTLIGRVALSVPVSVTCTPFDASYTLVATGVSVSVQQASGKDIASGSGFLSGGLSAMGQPTPLFACDDADHSVTVPVSANTAGSPFHGGHVVVNATASASAGQPCFPGSTNCFFNFITQSATTGPVEVHL
jgi:hypothetical protein